MKLHPGLRVLPVILLAGGVAMVVFSKKEIDRQRAEHEALTKDSAEAQRLTKENRDAGQLHVDTAEMEKLRQSNSELLKLRNEATQLRGQAADLAALRAENQRLAAQAKSIASQPGKTPITQLPDFVAKASLHDAGLATPEAAVQTFLWSVSQGNMQRLQQCMAPDTPMPFGIDSDAARQQVMEGTKNFEGFRITGRKDVSPDEVVLGVYVIGMDSPSEGETAPMPLKRVGNEWRLDFGPNGIR